VSIIEKQAIAKIDNCQRIQTEKLLNKQFGLSKAISAMFGNPGSSGNKEKGLKS
jgi:hypothetical protein